MNKLEFIKYEINKGRLNYVLFSIVSYPLSKTFLKEWRLKTKDLILVRNLTNQIKKNYGLRFLNIYSKFYCEALKEIYEKKIYDFFEIRKGEVVYDIGGGEYAILCAKNGAECLAFELRKDAFDIMNENIKLNNFNNTNKVPTLIKIDIEGDELKVLQGSIKILKKYHPRIILETHSKRLEKDCLNFLFGLKYKIKHKINMDKDVNLFFLEKN